MANVRVGRLHLNLRLLELAAGNLLHGVLRHPYRFAYMYNRTYMYVLSRYLKRQEK